MQADAVIARGLEGVVSHASGLSEVVGEVGRLSIRGYDIKELVGQATFEEAAYLLWHSELPDAGQLSDLQSQLAADRHLPAPVMDALRGPMRSATGMHALRMASSLLSIGDGDVDDVSPASYQRRAARIAAAMPALVAHQYRLHRGEDVLEPPDHLGVAAGYVYMLEGREPEPARVDALNAYMVAVIDHGMNASTFTARVIASTASDMVSAVTGAVGALKGPRHGGVPGPVLDMLQAIGRAEAAEAWVRSAMDRGERIMGFGHRVYKVRDPRAEVLATAATRLADAGSRDLLDLTREVERVTVKVLGELKPGRDLYANVELYAALVLHAIGIPSEIFTPTFAVARTAGWTAHILEQYGDNRLIRPQSVYVGPRDRAFVPLETR